MRLWTKLPASEKPDAQHPVHLALPLAQGVLGQQ